MKNKHRVQLFRGNILLLAGIIATAPFAIDTYLPAIVALAKDFAIQPAHAQLSISIFLVFFAIGQLFGGSLADRRGRRPVVISGLAGFTLASSLLPLSWDFDVLLVLRAIQAFCGGFATVACFAVARDTFSGIALAQVLSWVTSIMLIAPIFAPFVGTIILVFLSWKWIFWVTAAYSLLLIIASWKYFHETLDRDVLPGKVLHSYARVLSKRQSLLLLISSACSMAVMFVFLTSSSSIYQTTYAQSPQAFSLYFATNVSVVLLLTNLNIRLVRSFSLTSIMGFGLFAQCVSCALMVGFGNVLHLYTFSVLSMIAVGSIGLVLANASGLLLTLYPRDAGTVNAVAGLLRFLFGGIAGAIPSMLNTTGVTTMALVMLIAAVTGFVCLLACQTFPQE